MWNFRFCQIAESCDFIFANLIFFLPLPNGDRLARTQTITWSRGPPSDLFEPRVVEAGVGADEEVAEVRRLQIEVAADDDDVAQLARVAHELAELERLRDAVREVLVPRGAVLRVQLRNGRETSSRGSYTFL